VDKLSITRFFAARRLKVVFFNPKRLEGGKYRIKRFLLNAEQIPVEEKAWVIISREVITNLPKDKLSIIEVHLG
jgi:hypothetical protein